MKGVIRHQQQQQGVPANYSIHRDDSPLPKRHFKGQTLFPSQNKAMIRSLRTLYIHSSKYDKGESSFEHEIGCGHEITTLRGGSTINKIYASPRCVVQQLEC